MGLSTLALGASKKYTKATIEGEGAIKGKDGRDGKDGTNGKSAYEIAVELGFVGTETEWIASLVGAKGDKGDTGEQGEKGVGIESVTKQGTSGLVDTYVITFSDGTQTTYGVVNGANVTKTSQLENDNNFVDSATIGLINYYLKDEVYSKDKIDELLRNVGAGLSVQIVSTLPTEDISPTTIYLINTTGSQYNQYMWIDSRWANLGSTSVDLSSYYNKTQIDTMLLGYVNASTLLTQLMAYTKTADLAKVATSGDYNDLANLPTIPDVSGIKPYSENLQDSNNTAPTSKVVYDAVQTINGELEKKLEESDLEPYAKSEDVPEIDDTATSEDKLWSAKKISDSLVDKADIDDTSTSALDATWSAKKINGEISVVNANLDRKADKDSIGVRDISVPHMIVTDDTGKVTIELGFTADRKKIALIFPTSDLNICQAISYIEKGSTSFDAYIYTQGDFARNVEYWARVLVFDVII